MEKTPPLLDNPSLTTRLVEGNNPIRIIIDTELALPNDLKVFDGLIETIVFNFKKDFIFKKIEYVKIQSSPDIIPQVLHALWIRNIQSLLVEGGAYTLQRFIDTNNFDQIFKIKSNKKIATGLPAPSTSQTEKRTISFHKDTIFCYE